MGSFKMAKTLMKNLFNKPATDMYPVIPKQWEERTRGHVGIIEENCILCGLCAKKCPTSAISVDKKETKTWSIDRMSCIQCESCVEVCPKNCLVMAHEYTPASTEKITDTFVIPVKEKPEKTEIKAET